MKHLDKKIRAFVKLGEYLRKEKIDSELHEQIIKTESNNNWFTYNNSVEALKIWGNTLTNENILKWTSKYDFEKK